MTLTITDRSLFMLLLLVLAICVYPPKKRNVTPLPAGEPIPGTDWNQYRPPPQHDDEQDAYRYIELEQQ